MKRILNLIFRNFHYKVLALLFATLLWLLAANKETAEVTLNLKIYPEATGDYRVIDYRPKSFKITVEGFRRDLFSLKEKRKLFYPLPKDLGKEGGWIRVRLDREKLVLPCPSCKVKSISPPYLEVKVERLVKKAVPVKVRVSGLKEGLKVIVSPSYVIVYLPEELKDVIDSVDTEEVDLSEINGTGELLVKVKSNFKVEPDRVRLFIERESSGG